LDASRSVTVAGSLLSKEQKPEFLEGIKKEYDKLKEDFANKKTVKQYLRFEESQQNGAVVDWNNFKPVIPTFTGTKIFDQYLLKEIAEYIDWQPFFIAWEMHGKFPQILKDAVIGIEATKLFNDAKQLLNKIIEEKWLTAKGVVGYWPVNKTGPDTVDVNYDGSIIKLEFLRQQIKKAAGQPNLSLADFIAPAECSYQDHIGAFSVSIHGIDKHIKNFEDSHDDYNKIILQALADRLAEAFAELLHKRTRMEYWGYVSDEHLSNEQLIKEEYLGIRPAPGYPACPDHTEKYKLFELLGGEAATGIMLTESLAMYPASSVCGWYFANPESKYFGVGKIERDQLVDYAKRKMMNLDDAGRWLRPVLE
jgi:5-methyltetrahydrofolate--homocysteine methyltransferase